MKKSVLALALFLASCGSTDDKECEPGRQLLCPCAGGREGFQVCLPDGSGWGECDCSCDAECTGKCCGDDGCGDTCPDSCTLGYECNTQSCVCEQARECETNNDCPQDYWCDRTVWECKQIDCIPNCTGKCCGSDGCDGTCPYNCPSGYYCNQQSCICEPERECQTNADCPQGYWCDRTVWECKEIDCIPNCTGKCCGSDGCDGTCPDNCPSGYECNMTTCVCEVDDCCPGDPRYYIYIAGTVADMTTQQGVQIAVAPISPMDALTNPNPTHLDAQVSDINGSFQTDCFDVTNVALGCVMLADDQGFDGTAGNYFPTGTPVISWNTNAEKVCADDIKAFAVPSTLVAGLDAATSIDSGAYGFVMGLVVDASSSPVAGAVIREGDGTDLVEVIYPNATFTSFDGTMTSSTGIFILPHTNFAVGIIEIAAEKTGMTFGNVMAATKAGFCYFVVIQEAP